jgi:Uma2 family endonuclease
MISVNLQSTREILDATEHLPDGATLVVHQVEWDAYERLLEDLAGRPHLRVSYDCGRLEVVSPSSRHERHARLFDGLVREFATAQKYTVEMLGQTTWKRRAVAKGVEPDCCYYIQNAERVIGKEDLDPESDPPPDIAVEIDITNTSQAKLSIYAALLVPEIWRYDGKTVRIYELAAGKYVQVSESRLLPGLTGTLLGESVERSRNQGQTKALAEFRRKIRRRR